MCRNKRSSDASTGTVSKLSSGFHRIKGALKTPQPIEGAVYHSETHSFETVPSLFIETNIYRDLSAWRVAISQIEHVRILYRAMFHHVRTNQFY